MNHSKLLLLAPAVLSTAAGCNQGGQKKDIRPNIVFLLTDDQTFFTLNAFGNTETSTPNMDRLAECGTAFTGTHVMGGFNGAVSQPSRAMLLTGRGLMDTHRNGSIIPESETTFPEFYRGTGYTTFGTGKWHSDKASFNRSFSTGANIFFGGMHTPKEGLGHLKPFLHQYDSTGRYKNGKWIEDGKFSSELYADAVIDFITGKKESGNPFLVYCAFTSPHDPRNEHPDYGRKYNASEVSLPVNFLTEHPFDNGDMDVRDELLLPTPRDPEAVKKEIADYYGMVNEVDVQIGRIIDALKKNGQFDNTIIVFAADNGLTVGSHGLLGKQNLYEESIRVPLIFCGPGIPKNEVRTSYNYLYDIFPTLCDLTGTEPPASVRGKSLTPEMKDKDVHAREAVYLAFMNLQRAVKKDGYKLIRYNVNGEDHPQLFNLNEDPRELRNLYGMPEYKEIQDGLTELLQKMMEEDNDICDLTKEGWGLPEKLTGEKLKELRP